VHLDAPFEGHMEVEVERYRRPVRQAERAAEVATVRIETAPGTSAVRRSQS